MSVTTDSLAYLEEQHWALKAVGSAARIRALDVARYMLVTGAVGKQIVIEFKPREGDMELIERVAAAYELAAIEGLSAILHVPGDDEGRKRRDTAISAAYRAYELRRVLPVPADDLARVFHILHDGAIAYCGDRWTDLRRWLKEHPEASTAPSVANVAWDRRILYRLFDCWVRLFRKNQWDDLDQVREIVAGLRGDQAVNEAALLAAQHEQEKSAAVFRLIALYHWAKGTELLAIYMMQGEPVAVSAELDRHFEAAQKAAVAAVDPSLEVVIRWLHVAARRMVLASLWWVAQAVNSRVTKFVRHTTRAPRPMFELLPPQRAALQEQGLLDTGKRAIVVNLPTSGGKTVLAQFRMLQALNQFDHERGWVAYIAPTKALVSQITRRLRTDFEPLGINVEQLTPAVDLDSTERVLLEATDGKDSFHILVATPEKLGLVIRNKVVPRPLALVVLDEAHNIEDEERGLRIELLLASIKRDCPTASYLLLMPFVPNSGELAAWLGAEQGASISLGTSAWQPNERLVGTFEAIADHSQRAGWQMVFDTHIATPRAMHLKGRHLVGPVRPLDRPFSGIENASTAQAGAMAKILSQRGTSIAVANRIDHTWSLAREVKNSLPPLDKPDADIALVQRFLATEISADFELIGMLDRGVGVHHAGLSEETRSLMEWLAENGKLRVLCATTTIAQGINFPVASVFLSSVFFAAKTYPFQREMSKRAFWNLAGRAGRVGQDSVGVVGVAAGRDQKAVANFIAHATEDLVSRLALMIRQIDEAKMGDLVAVLHEPQWSDFRSYIAHLWNEQKNLEGVLAETETVLRNTLGYSTLQGSTDRKEQRKARVLLDATRQYATELAAHPENSTLADSTGFDPEGVRAALLGLGKLEIKLQTSDWQPASLFGAKGNSVLPQLVGVMMQIPQIRGPLDELGGEGIELKHVANIANAWVTGKSIQEIATTYFADENPSPEAMTNAITKTCRGIYKALANAGTWGLAALSHMPTSGIDFVNLGEDQRRAINTLPAMLYHGVNSEAAVLMRLNSVPRSIAPIVGDAFAAAAADNAKHNVRSARQFLRSLTIEDWDKLAPKKAKMSGSDYRTVWAKLSGEEP